MTKRRKKNNGAATATNVTGRRRKACKRERPMTVQCDNLADQQAHEEDAENREDAQDREEASEKKRPRRARKRANRRVQKEIDDAAPSPDPDSAPSHAPSSAPSSALNTDASIVAASSKPQVEQQQQQQQQQRRFATSALFSAWIGQQSSQQSSEEQSRLVGGEQSKRRRERGHLVSSEPVRKRVRLDTAGAMLQRNTPEWTRHLEKVKGLLDAIDDKVCARLTSHLTDSFSQVFRYVHETVMTMRPLRTVQRKFLHQQRIVECVFLPPSNNGNPLPPRIAKQRQLTYSNEIYIRVEYSVHAECKSEDDERSAQEGVRAEGERISHDDRFFCATPCHSDTSEPVHLGTIPQMVRAAGCLQHTGDAISDPDPHKSFPGFFIVSGTPKVMAPVERLRNNHAFLFDDTQAGFKFVEFRAAHHAKPHRSTSTFLLKMNRFHAKRPDQSHRIMVEVPFVDDAFPLLVLYMALGWHSDDIVAAIRLVAGEHFYDDFLPYIEIMLHGHNGCVSQRDALLSISQFAHKTEPQAGKRITFALQTLRNEFMPQLGFHDDVNVDKGLVLSEMVWRLLMFVTGRMSESDRDDIKYKAFDSAATMIANLFRQLVRITTRKSSRTHAEIIEKNKQIDVNRTFHNRNTTPRMISCFSSGDWSAKKSANNKRTNITQAMLQMNEQAKLSHLLRIGSVGSTDCKNDKRRDIPAGAFGRLCPSETPEGSTCGLVKHMSIGAQISSGSSHTALARIMFSKFPFVPLYEWRRIQDGTAVAQPGVERMVRRPQTREVLPSRKRKRHSGSASTSSSSHPPVGEVPLTLSRESAAAKGAAGGRHCEQREHEQQWIKVFFNGVWLCWIPRSSGADFVADVRKLRRSMSIGRHTSVTPLPGIGEIRVSTVRGRICRPLATWEAIASPPERLPNAAQYTLSSLLMRGLAEYVDADEEETLSIAQSAEEFLAAEPGTFTHCQISQDHMFSASVAFIPFAPHNQCCRNTYQAAMGKQAQQVWATRPRGHRSSYALDYGQRPLLHTRTARQLGMNKVHSGTNLRIAILCYEGLNIEDSVILKKSLVERGAYISSETKRHKEEQKKHGSSNNCEFFQLPRHEHTKCAQVADYSCLDQDGLISSNTLVTEDCIVIGKTAPNHSIPRSANASVPESMKANSATSKRRDISVALSKGENGVVVQTMMTHGRNPNLRTATTLVRMRRHPEIGDKFSSRHGQKGTAGYVMPDEDMPFNRHGSVDIIINPHCIPSRKTVGHLAEAIVSVAGLLDDQIPLEVRSIGTDMTLTIENSMRVLRAFGLAPSGKERFQNGRTGEMIEGRVYTGLIHYQRLKHMVGDKKHARGPRGPRQIVTRQPREGRKSEGGLRHGHMEGDVLCTHGAAHMHRERLISFSDEFNMMFCEQCGFAGEYNPAQSYYFCRYCQKSDTLCHVAIPYAFKLEIQEMMSDGIAMRLKLKCADKDASIWCPESKPNHPQLYRFHGKPVKHSFAS